MIFFYVQCVQFLSQVRSLGVLLVMAMVLLDPLLFLLCRANNARFCSAGVHFLADYGPVLIAVMAGGAANDSDLSTNGR